MYPVDRECRKVLPILRFLFAVQHGGREPPAYGHRRRRKASLV